MPLEHQRRVRERHAADLHRQRRGGHQQVHDAIAQRRAGRRHDEDRLAHDLAQGAAAAGARCPRCLGRKADQRDHPHRQQRHQRQGQIGREEWRAERVARLLRQVGAGDGADQAASQHQRDRLFPEGGRGQFAGGKAIQLAVGAVVARHQRGGDQQPEAVPMQCGGAGQRRQQRHPQAELERGLAAPARLAARDQSGRERAADHIAHDGQRRHPAQRRQAQADQAVDCDEDHVVGQEQALRGGQQPEIRVHGGIRLEWEEGGRAGSSI